MEINGEQRLWDRTSTEGVVYYGKSASGTATNAPYWSIAEITVDEAGQPVSVLWAEGTQSEVNKWTERTTLIYS